ncbi:hypothetical protein [Xanthomonas phage f20-Xaj]|uniref:Uncharacterized protein n=2 Tax=Pradovirus TaxID=1985733 RepID=A0A127AVL4_9CAUD|nr:host RecBCD nuclease inhibitor [Xanthomonas phage f20-Xaj]YP_009276323.1 host RecBCD nuclease inhibitor [Xanthomonas phage f30-Xaj]AMM44669.1 hypothetical protein [Xanthomonas phage f20-Xaj]AMM44692.1 hypothetical protein [Xanthomonas phage f30-Xaj]
MVNITVEEYDALVAAKDELDALHAGGVSSWDWYDQSLQDAGFFDQEDEEED